MISPPTDMSCGNNPCGVLGHGKREGQQTQGRCRCDDHALRRGLRWWQAEARRLDAQVERLLEMLAETFCPPDVECPLAPEGNEPDCRACWDKYMKKARE